MLRKFLAAAIVTIALSHVANAADRLTIFAAASLKNALDAVSESWKADGHTETANSYAATSALARQIMEGAPADIFFSADMDWMNKLSEGKFIKDGTVVKLLGNEIVLVVPKDAATTATIAPGFDLAGLLGEGRLAMADVKAVPAGKYGKAALESLGVWASVESKLAMAENVRAALKFVATGEAPAGIVYATDASAEPAVKVLGVFPASSHPEIIYPVAITASSANADAAEFLAYLQSEKAQAIFRQQGFTVLVPAAN